jgi:Tfp pilus assembly protein FimT
LELVLVMAVIVVLSALVLPTFRGMYADAKIKGAADEVRGRWAEARAHAVNEGRAYRFAVILDKGNYRVAPEGTNYWSGADLPTVDDGTTPPYIVEGALPKGIYFVAPDSTKEVDDHEKDTALEGSVDQSMWKPENSIIFLPDGSAQDDREFRIVAPAARPIQLRFRALTGHGSMRVVSAREN